MHEFSIVESLTNKILHCLAPDGAGRIAAVRVRRGPGVSEEALRQSFQVLSAGTRLEGAFFSIDRAPIVSRCQCGHSTPATGDDVAGHLFVCPECGAVNELREAHDLEVVEVVVEDSQKRAVTR